MQGMFWSSKLNVHFDDLFLDVLSISALACQILCCQSMMLISSSQLAKLLKHTMFGNTLQLQTIKNVCFLGKDRSFLGKDRRSQDPKKGVL